jgi:hypothetical protein
MDGFGTGRETRGTGSVRFSRASRSVVGSQVTAIVMQMSEIVS